MYDLTSPSPPPEIAPASLDIVTCIFVLSALHPSTWPIAASNIFKMLKPGGILLVRDYGRYDMAQLRFKKERLMEDGLYVRGDGTRVYFFENEDVRKIFGEFEELKNAMDRRMLVNRFKKIKMYRCWVQAKFRKPL